MTDDNKGLQSPDPDYGPREVVEIQIEALRSNDEPSEDSGIESAFNFASQNNKRATGPISRFKKMVHNKRYSKLLNHDTADSKDFKLNGDEATQILLVEKNGKERLYEFGLEKQKKGPNEGCWMTNSVLLVD